MSGYERRREDNSIWQFLLLVFIVVVSVSVGWMLHIVSLDKTAADAVKDRPYLELKEVYRED